ncbi:MAG: histidinol-phosphate transaminase [Bryobacterales bacterium]|nr:histidinol-phosphate transaminase [Bryobacterales bacterium]MBV9396632.1 histidinol-phosphate transaminase [Bryobacterales bacterium]
MNDALVPPYIAAMEPYVTGLSIEEVRRRFGLERVIKLASNENPLGPSPRAIAAVKAAVSGANRYPDGGRGLREKLAERFDVRLENVIAGSGSEGIMANIVRTFLADNDEVLASEGTFPSMRALAQSRGVAYKAVPMRGWNFDLAAIADAITPRTKLIYLPNPNNPTGSIFTTREFEEFHKRVPERVLIIQDEAYFEYARNPVYPDSLRYRYDNVITLRTFSKVYGLAGFRVGYGFAHQDLIGMLLKVKLPFEPSSVASAAAIAALDDVEFLKLSLETNAKGMQQLTSEVKQLGLEPAPSEANFVMLPLSSPERAEELFSTLLQEGVIVRPLKSFGLPSCVRITIGTPEENDLCVAMLQRILKTELALA